MLKSVLVKNGCMYKFVGCILGTKDYSDCWSEELVRRLIVSSIPSGRPPARRLAPTVPSVAL